MPAESTENPVTKPRVVWLSAAISRPNKTPLSRFSAAIQGAILPCPMAIFERSSGKCRFKTKWKSRFQVRSPSSRFPRIGVAALILVSIFLVEMACQPEDATLGVVGMRISSSKANYRSDEQIVVSVLLSNLGRKACQIIKVPEGTISILSVTRDEVRIEPVATLRTYIDGFRSFLVSNRVVVAPGASLSLSLVSDHYLETGDRAALSSSTLDESDEASVARWLVDQPGHYTVTARYFIPNMVGSPAGLCSTSSEPVSTSFTVIKP
jgi:hypothetical protein